MDSAQRLYVILRINVNNTDSVLARADAVDVGFTKDTTRFANPVPPLPVFEAQTAKVVAAEKLVATRAPGAAAARNVERRILVGMLETQCSYVQTLCDAVAPDVARAIAEAAGMFIAAARVRNKPILMVTRGAAGGAVDLEANATILVGKSGKKTCYNWQWTGDGGKTFNNVASTPHARTTIENLTPLTMIGFRVNVSDADGPGEWSPIVTILVH